MANDARKLAPDANVAEKGVEIEGDSRKTVLSVIEKFLGFFVNIVRPEGRSEGGDSPKVVPSNQDKSNDEAYESDLGPFTQYCSDNANVWKYYMHRATVLDDELAKVLNGDLDPLLIFAGLFSAILSAFLIEIRKGLQEDLQDTTNALLRILIQDQRNLTIVPTTSRFEPTSTSSWVNGLWFSSLMFSLMSALGASLAKGWVTQYSSTGFGTTWRDAASHHRRYKGMLRWGMRLIIQGLPILIHIAFFLFAIGLTVLLFNDDIRIGGVVLVLVFVTASLYVTAIVHVYRVPDSPFRTPVSDLISWLTRRREAAGRQLEPSFTNSTDDYLFKAEALGWLLTESADSDVIAETVRAIAGLPAGPNVQDKLYHLSVVNILSQGISMSIDDKSDDKSDTLKAYLHAVLRLVQAKPRVSEATGDPICDVLVSMVNSGGSLHLSKCRKLNSELYEVALCVNARIHLIFKKDRDETLFGTDIPVLMRSTTQRYIRQLLFEVHLLGGTQKGIGPEFANTGSYLTEIMTDNRREDGHKALVRRAQSDEFIMTLVSTFGIMSLLEGLQSPSLNVCNEYLDKCLELCSFQQFRRQICECGVLQQLFVLLWTQDKALRNNAVNFVKRLSNHNDTWEAFASPTLQEKIFKGLEEDNLHMHELLCDLVLTFSKHESLRFQIITSELVNSMLSNFGAGKKSADCRALCTIQELSAHDNVRLPILRAFTQRLDAMLSSDHPHVRKWAVDVIQSLAKHDDSRMQIIDLMKILTKRLDDRNAGVRQAAIRTIREFTIHDDSRAYVSDLVPFVIEKLGDNDWFVRISAIKIIKEFVIHDDRHAHVEDLAISIMERQGDNNWAIQKVVHILIHPGVEMFEHSDIKHIHQYINKLGDDKQLIQEAAINIINNFVLHDQSHVYFTTHFIRILMEKLDNKDSDVQLAVIFILRDFTDHGNSWGHVVDFISSLIERLGNSTWFVRREAARILGDFLDHDDSCAHVADIIPFIMKRLDDSNENSNVQTEAIKAIGKLVIHDGSRGYVIALIPSLMEKLDNDNYYVQEEVVKILREFAIHDDSHAHIADLIPSFTKRLGDKRTHVRQGVINIIRDFFLHDDSHMYFTIDFMKIFTERRDQGLDDENWNIRLATINILQEFAVHDNSRAYVLDGVIPYFKTMLGDENLFVRKATIKIIKEFVIHDDSRGHVVYLIPSIMNRLNDKYLNVVHEAIKTIEQFVMHDDSHAQVTNYIPELMKRLGDDERSVQKVTINMIKELAIRDDSRVCFTNLIPTLIETLGNDNSDIRKKMKNIFIELIHHDCVRMQVVAQGLIKTIMHVVIPLDHDGGISLLVELTNYSDIHAELLAPEIIDFVMNQMRTIKSSTLQDTYGKTLMHLFSISNESVTNDIFHRIMMLLVDPDSSVVRVGLHILSDLAKREPQRNYLCKSFDWAHFTVLLGRHDTRVAALTALRGLAQYGDVLEVMSHEFKLVSGLLDMLKSKSNDIERWAIAAEGLLLLGLFS